MPAKKQKSFVPSIKSVKSPSKRRIIVGLLLIAVLGGVALVLRSLAAGPYTLVRTMGRSAGFSYNDGIYMGVNAGSPPTCSRTSVYDDRWKFNVAVLGCQQRGNYADHVWAHARWDNPGAGNWKLCAWVIGVSKGLLFEVFLGSKEGGTKILNERIPIFNNSQYQYLCTQNSIWADYGKTYGAQIAVYPYADSGTIVRVASINLVRQ